MHLKSYTLTPPGGYTILDPKTGVRSGGSTFNNLLKNVATARQNNGVVTEGNLAHEVEELLCARLSPASQCEHCETGRRPPAPINWQVVQRFMITAKEFIKEGTPLVSSEEAERRAGICTECPYNVGMVGCSLCQATLTQLRESLLKVSTSHDKDLLSCGVCGCDNKTQVHIPLDVMPPAPELDFPEWCWKRALSHGAGP